MKNTILGHFLTTTKTLQTFYLRSGVWALLIVSTFMLCFLVSLSKVSLKCTVCVSGINTALRKTYKQAPKISSRAQAIRAHQMITKMSPSNTDTTANDTFPPHVTFVYWSPHCGRCQHKVAYNGWNVNGLIGDQIMTRTK